jgi:hypothetical protein
LFRIGGSADLATQGLDGDGDPQEELLFVILSLNFQLETKMGVHFPSPQIQIDAIAPEHAHRKTSNKVTVLKSLCPRSVTF